MYCVNHNSWYCGMYTQVNKQFLKISTSMVSYTCAHHLEYRHDQELKVVYMYAAFVIMLCIYILCYCKQFSFIFFSLHSSNSTSLFQYSLFDTYSLSSQSAVELLRKKGQVDGSFLVRPNSRKPAHYALTLVHNQMPFHYEIICEVCITHQELNWLLYSMIHSLPVTRSFTLTFTYLSIFFPTNSLTDGTILMMDLCLIPYHSVLTTTRCLRMVCPLCCGILCPHLV